MNELVRDMELDGVVWLAFVCYYSVPLHYHLLESHTILFGHDDLCEDLPRMLRPPKEVRGQFYYCMKKWTKNKVWSTEWGIIILIFFFREKEKERIRTCFGDGKRRKWREHRTVWSILVWEDPSPKLNPIQSHSNPSTKSTRISNYDSSYTHGPNSIHFRMISC